MADISISGIRKFYGKTEVLRGIDLKINDGDFVVILGPSGCGKSTLLRMIAGLEDITGGTIAIDDIVVNDLEPGERNCAMVFQNYALYPHMTVAQNIGYPLKIAGVKRSTREERVSSVAETLGLGAFLDRKPSQLSGGQRQRVAMGRAMIREPAAFLFDEPLSNLDATLRVQMRLEIRRLHKRLNATSIFVTHDQVEAMTLADCLVVMRDGHIEQMGTPAEIYNTPVSRFVAGFIGAPPMNFIECEVKSDNLLALPAGEALRLLPGRHFLQAEARVTLGFRPEAARLGLPGSGLRFETDVVEELGSGTLLHGRLAGSDIVVALAAAARPPNALSTSLDVHLPADALHFFDARTGRRLDDRKDLATPSILQVAGTAAVA